MFFTQEDFKKIEQYLQRRTIKDTEFPNATPLSGTEKVAIIQDGTNRVADVDTIFKFNASLPFVNITAYTGKVYNSIVEAIVDVPEVSKKKGVVVTYNTPNNGWSTFQFTANVSEDWNDINNWAYYLGSGDNDLFSSVGDGLEIKDMVLGVKALDTETLNSILV